MSSYQTTPYRPNTNRGGSWTRPLMNYALRSANRYASSAISKSAYNSVKRKLFPSASKAKATERPTNSDTILNTNNTFNATSLFTRKRKGGWSKGKKVAFKRRQRFKKSITKALTGFKHWNTAHYVSTTLIDSSYTTSASPEFQHIHPTTQYTTPRAMMQVGATPAVSVAAGLGETYNHLFGIGWVEDGAAQNPASQPKDNLTLQWREKLQMTIKCNDTSDVSEEFKAFADIYEFVAARNITTSTEHALYDTPWQAWDNCTSTAVQQVPAGGLVAAQSLNDKGLRPGDCPELKKWWTITKVTRVQFTGKNEYLYDLHSSGMWKYGVVKDLKAVKGDTKTILMIVDAVGIPNIAAPDFVSDYQFHTTKTIQFRRMDSTNPSVVPAKPEMRWGYTEKVTMSS